MSLYEQAVGSMPIPSG